VTASTVYLGQFTLEHANAIAEQLEAAGIEWWAKNPGSLTRFFFMEWGARIFVDREREKEAREIASAVAPDGLKRRRDR
jgi:hypothetical protein